MRFSTTKGLALIFLAFSVIFWQTQGSANLHAETMDPDMSRAESAECNTELPCLIAIHVSPDPFIPAVAVLALTVLLAFIISTASSSSNNNLQRFRLYSKKWKVSGGTPHLFDYLQNFLTQGLLQPKVAFASFN